jgi:hypothetical protein
MKSHLPRTVMLYVLCVIVSWWVISALLSILIKLILGPLVVAGAVTSTAGQLLRLPTMKTPKTADHDEASSCAPGPALFGVRRVPVPTGGDRACGSLVSAVRPVLMVALGNPLGLIDPG